MMPLPRPSLDSRDFDQLVDEGVSRLPRLAPDVTDYNTSSPSITLLDLLAWRTEAALYQLDRTPPALARGFLRRLGVSPRPAQVAETVLLASAANAPFVLPEGLQVADAGEVTVFQTTQPLAVSAARLVRVVTVPADPSAPAEDWTAANAGGTPYPPFGADPAPGAALYLGFDAPLGAPGTVVRLHAWTSSHATDRETRARLVAEQDAALAEWAAACPAASAAGLPDWRRHYGVETVWEYHQAGGAWSALPDLVDATRALSLTEAVEFTVPADHVAGGPDPTQMFVRCRIVAGTYDCPPRLDRIAHNAVAVRHAADAPAPEALGTSRGHAEDRFRLARRPVVAGSTSLSVALPSGPDLGWLEVANWDTTGPHDRHYLLDADDGLVSCGNGDVGRVFPAGATLEIAYRVGGGIAGNVAEETLDRAVPSAANTALYQAANGGASPDWTQLVLRQPYAAQGGALAETFGAAAARANEVAFAGSRAVTLDDFRRLALDAPGVPIARAHALPDYHPAYPCFAAPGSVTVVVVPACPDYRDEPSAALLSAVARHLERRRTVATEVHVAPPLYTTVVVTATLHVDGRADHVRVERDARAALERFFHPLHGGPDGDGWPSGRAVYRAEVLALLSGVPSVDSVTDLGLAEDGDREPRCGNLPICPDGLVRSGAHVLCVDAPPPLAVIDRSKPHECP